ncbi:MAG: rhodanese-like domain-containing protein, partial [Pseudomonadota bacterium]
MTEMYRYPEAIISGAALEAALDDPALRIYDCTFYLDYEEGTGRPYSVRSGREDWLAGHVPGAAHLDLQGDFSDPGAPTSFMHLTPAATAEAFARAGIGEGARVVLYSRGSPNRATRFWWMLRWIGFDSAAILDGGMDLWEAEGRPLATGEAAYPAARLTAQVRAGLWADKAEVLAAIGSGAVCTLNALDADLHSGANPRYGRAGRIPGSTNVPSSALIDARTMRLVAPEAAA